MWSTIFARTSIPPEIEAASKQIIIIKILHKSLINQHVSSQRLHIRAVVPMMLMMGMN